MDMGLGKLTDVILHMAEVSENSVNTAINSYVTGKNQVNDILLWSNELGKNYYEVKDLAVELIARYQPVATDLRFIESSLEISYGFFRFGRYALDIAQVLDIFGDLSQCDSTLVQATAKITKEMIHKSIEAYATKDVELAKSIPDMDDYVDEHYRSNLMNIVKNPKQDLKCSLATTLILRYLERIADHSAYIGESVAYIITGEKIERVERVGIPN
jgi:phosphate transport system protein